METDDKLQRVEPGANVLEAQPARPLLTPYETVPLDETPDLLTYWRVIRKRRWTISTIFFVVFTLILIGTLKQTPIYRARTLLEIQKENPDILSVQELFELETVSDTYLETQFKILKSESLARRVVDQLGLVKLEEFNPPKRWWSFRRERSPKAGATQTFGVGGAVLPQDPAAYQRTLETFAKRLNVEPVKRSRLVEVSFESQDPELAAKATNTLAANFVEQSLEARWEATQIASEWISQQLLGLKSKLEKSEEELQQYARENGLLFLEGQTGKPENIVNERLRQLQEELTKAQAARYEKEALYRLVEAGDYGSLPGVFEVKLMQDLTVRLAELRREHAQLVTTFTPDYPKVKQVQSQIDEVEDVLAHERDRAARRITNDYVAATKRESLLRQAFEAQQEQANQVAERSVQYNILKREVETNKQLYEGLLQRLKEAGVSAGLKASNIRVVDPAEPPQEAAKPRVLLNLGLGLILGLALGVGSAFLQEYLDDTLKTAGDVERFLHLPSLAMIPSVESLNGRRGPYGLYAYGRRKLLPAQGLSGVASPQSGSPPGGGSSWYRIDAPAQQISALSEAFRSLRTSVLLSTANRPPRSLVVTSAQPGEGKTTVSLNLAISMAQLGQRVLLIDGDMRRPCVHKILKLAGNRGLVSYFTGQEDWRSVVQPSGVTHLDALVCGPVPPNPAELLSSDRAQALLIETMESYSFVVIDSPPLLSVADSRILVTMAEGTILVVKGAGTSRELVSQAQSHVQNIGGNLIGVVLNNLDIRSDGYSYYYRYDYEDPREEARERE